MNNQKLITTMGRTSLQCLRFLDRSIDFTLNKFISQDRYINILEKEIIGNCETLLDVGCGNSSPINAFSQNYVYSIGVDIFEPYITESRNASIHNEYRIMGALEIGNNFKDKTFDCVLAAGLIEHLPKEEGLKLIKMMEKIAKKKVIIFTPNGFLPQGGCNGNKFQRHLSGWKSKEMKKMGYRVIGLHGWKSLRGEYGVVRGGRYISFIVGKISLLTQIITDKYPALSFEILCIKDL
ncbi:MAG: methyltransferase domain-containing protein [Thermoplasmata archaeon]